MKRAIRFALVVVGAVAALTLFLAGVGLYITAPAAAYPPLNNRWIAGAESYSPVIAHVAQAGELTYSVTDNYGWPAWRSTVRQALDAGSSDPLSLANVLNDYLAGAGYIGIREAGPGEVADVDQRAESPGVTNGMCGGSFATACAYISSSRPQPTIYNAGSMSTWAYPSNAAVVRHEVFHHLAWACDQYVGGCPPTNNQGFQCTGNPDSLMDCGGAARSVTPFDYITFLGTYTPDHASSVSAQLAGGGWVAVRWNLNRRDAGAHSPMKGLAINSRAVAFAFRVHGGDWVWAGSAGCGAEFNYCYGDPRALTRSFDAYWTSQYDCVAIRFENPLTLFIPQSSAWAAGAGYWQQAGCWR